MTSLIPPHLHERIAAMRSRWLVTGAAGFIGSNLVEALLAAGQAVVGLDNFATGHRRNLEEIERLAGSDSASRLSFIEGDIRDRDSCRRALDGVDIVLHQAALGSVPRSLADPLTTHDVNVTGFVNMIEAARQAGVRRFVYAASSSTYGSDPNLPKREDRIGEPLSPYALSKLANEQCAAVYARCFGFSSIGLRYFNVFGPRQDPDGPYAAVIPKWLAAMVGDQPVTIFGDGETSRDFCFIANAVQVNLLAAIAPDEAQNQVYNVAVGERTSLAQLFELLRRGLQEHQVHYRREPHFADFRPGDVRHSQADIAKARSLLGYAPTHNIAEGIAAALPWYLANLSPASA